jgi:hypothetical protein
MIKQWQETGMTQVAFCREQKISDKVFGYWYRKYKKENNQNSFLPVQVNPENTPIETAPIEIHYPNMVRLLIDSNTPIEKIRQLTGMQ